MQDIYWKINIFFITSIVFMILAVAVDFIVVYVTLKEKKGPILGETLESSIAFLFSIILLVYFWVFAEMITVEELAGTSTESKDQLTTAQQKPDAEMNQPQLLITSDSSQSIAEENLLLESSQIVPEVYRHASLIEKKTIEGDSEGSEEEVDVDERTLKFMEAELERQDRNLLTQTGRDAFKGL